MTDSDLTGGPGGFDAVLFDFGGVFIDSPFAVAEAAAAKLGLHPDELMAVVFGPYDSDTDHPWHRLERGELSFDAARDEIRRLSLGAGTVELDPMAVLAELGSGGRGVREFMVDVVRDVRSTGVRTGVVTNNIAEFAEYWRPMIPLDELFDDVVDSSQVGLRKPDPAIYLLACERLSVDPARTVFVDDFDGNVVGAEAVGMVGVACGWTRESSAEAALVLRGLLGLAGA